MWRIAKARYRRSSVVAPLLRRVQSLLYDSGYVGKLFAQGVQAILRERVNVQIARRSQLHTFKVMPKRWTSGAQLCLAAQEQTLVEELLAPAQYLLAVRPLGFLGDHLQRIQSAKKAAQYTTEPLFRVQIDRVNLLSF